ncbi:hypothetical protein AABB24_028029 [Solanum stoloniferum]|uniref:Uncharacterized protein n=1 Tax=Solanum stoloniferum TaxID=62892 RepID=A0ABD2S4Q8_9SOLN
MSILQADAINSRAADVAEWLHSVIDIPSSPLGTTPHEELTHKIHFDIPHTFAESTSKEDYYKYYEPRVVSIGPFHNGKPHVAPMENFKRKAVRELEERVKYDVSIEQVYASVEQDLLRITKECYNVSRWHGISDRGWCLMMFLDGCFVIEFITNNNITTSGRRNSLNTMKKHESDLVRRDLLLLENQLPFQILDTLALAFRCEWFTLHFLTLRFLQMPLLMISSAPSTSTLTDYIEEASCRCPLQQGDAPDPVHLLQYYRDLWINVLFKDDVEKEEEEEEDHQLFSVTDLKKVGIRCSCAIRKDIHLKSSILSGRLFLPQLIIDEWTLPLFYNLVTYENLSLEYTSFGISSYLCFMSMLINGEEDVKELRARGVIHINIKFSDDQVVNFLRDITAHHEPNPQVFKPVKRQISTYFKSKNLLPLRVGYAEFKQRYFSGPWSFLVFLAVIFTVSMTVIQTVFTGIQTYKKG